MTICEAGDVAVVPFPFTDIVAAKARPALALSPKPMNEESGNTLFAMITTARRSRWPNDVSLQDLAECGLSVPSVVRMKLFTLDNRLVARRIGVLSPRDRQAVRRCLRAALAV